MTARSQTLLVANLMCMASMVIWAMGLPAAAVLIPLLPPLPLSAARISLAAVVLLPLWLLVEGAGAMRAASWRRGIVVGSSIGAGALLLVIGQSLSNPVTVAVVSATLPVVGIALEVAMDGRKLTLGLLVGLALCLAGGLLALGENDGTLGLGWGALCCLGSVFVFTLGSRLTVTAFPDQTPLGRTTVTLTGAALAVIAATAIHAGLGGPVADWTVIGWREFGALAMFGIGGLALHQLLWITSVGRLGIGVAALHINAAPFYVMILLYALGGSWNWWQALGAAIVGLGVLIAQGIVRLGPAPQPAG